MESTLMNLIEMLDLNLKLQLIKYLTDVVEPKHELDNGYTMEEEVRFLFFVKNSKKNYLSMFLSKIYNTLNNRPCPPCLVSL